MEYSDWTDKKYI